MKFFHADVPETAGAFDLSIETAQSAHKQKYSARAGKQRVRRKNGDGS